MSRNQERLLSDAMITDIGNQMSEEIKDKDTRDTLMCVLLAHYLQQDKDSLLEFINEWIEEVEDDILLTLNMELKEDTDANI